MKDQWSFSLRNAQPRVREVTLPKEGVPAGLMDKTILFVTDVHYSWRFSTRALEALFQKIEVLAPDLLLWGGDLADEQKWLVDFCARAARLKIPMGQYCVPGNNDVEAVSGDRRQLRTLLHASGITLLLNEKTVLSVLGGRLILSGIDDPRHGSPSTRAVRFGRLPGDYQILLSHSPFSLDSALAGSTRLPQLALCGHTHAGQIVLGRFSPYSAGYERKYPYYREDPRFFLVHGQETREGMILLVSAGVGTSLIPLRVGAPPEIHRLRFSGALPQ